MMIWLVSGVALWAIMHFIPTVLPRVRGTLITSLGEKPYSGIFALAVLASLVMMVVATLSRSADWCTKIPAKF